MWDIVIVLTLLLFLPAAYLFYSKFRSKDPANRSIYALFAAGAATFLLTTSLSSPLWDNLSALQKIQFPWRFLGPASLVGSVLFVLGVKEILARSEKVGRSLAYALALTVTVIVVFDLTQSIIPSGPVPRETLEKQIASLDEKAGCECWWPIWGKEQALENTEKVSAAARPSKIHIWEDTSRSFVVEAGEPTDVRVATFYYPHWRSEVNGIEVPVGMDENGVIMIPVKSERSEVRLYFSEPSFLRSAKIVSLLTWFGVALLFVLFLRRRAFGQMPLVS
jgi:hypothetical protein